MVKPRIIIADLDTNYIIPLQLKFVEDFFDKVDLEIVSDKIFFENMFLSPQRADILIISEELYDPSLQRHNIGQIFIMTEQYEEGQTEELSVNKLFKYTSIKEIFKEITGKSASVLNIESTTKSEPQIILVYSACGGVGKTTVAMGIGACLTKNYKRVLYINAERLQSFQRMLENSSPITTTEVYQQLAVANERVYFDIKHMIRQEMFHYLPPFKASLMSLGLPYSIYEKIALSAKKSNDYDFIIIDADSTFDEDKANLMNLANKVIIVTNQTKASVFGTDLLIGNVNGINPEKYFFICNNFNKDEDNALILHNTSSKFIINDYIERFTNYDRLKCEDISKNSGIQKITFLVM